MKIPVLVLLPVVFFAAWPGLTAAPTGVLVLAAVEKSVVAVSLVQPADYLCAIVEVSSGEKDAAAQADSIKKTLAALGAEAAKAPGLELHRGPVRLSSFGSGSGSGLFSSVAIGYSKSNGGELGAQVTILLRLDPQKPNPLDGAALIRGVLAKVKAVGDANLRLASLNLAVDTSESRRPELLKRISEETAAMRMAFGGGAVTVAGLESPVLVRQVDEAHVELFLDYRLSVDSGK